MSRGQRAQVKGKGLKKEEKKRVKDKWKERKLDRWHDTR